jgi:uncharacterized protein YsxB (DUF464 family)
MKLSYIIIAVTVLFSTLFVSQTRAQQRFTISGHIKDAANGEDIIGAGVSLRDQPRVGTSSNIYGFFSLTLPQGKQTIIINSLGYITQTLEVDLTKDITLNINLESSSTQLKEIEIQSERQDANIRSVEMSVNKLDIKTIQKIPALLGEVDIIRSIQLLPGVTTVGEGASGFNVRGGGIDQNLVLLDDAPVYNSSHLFGFFSVFNPDAVKDVKLVKGGIPAQYGGRLSSLLDVRMKDGNNKDYKVNGGVGTIFSRLSVEGPLVKDQSSFIIAGRRSYFDIFFPLANDPNVKNATAYFYDLTAKVNTVLGEKDRLYLSGYFGRDRFGFGGRNGFFFNWGNATGTLRWNHIYNTRLFSNLSLIYSNYDYAIGAGDKVNGFRWNSRIINYSIKPEYTFYLNPTNTITFGGQSIFYNFTPGELGFQSDGIERKITGDNRFTIENNLYIANEQRVGGRVALQYGLRYSNFSYLGKGIAYTFRDTTPNIRRDTISSRQYSAGEIIAAYNYLEPRFSIKFDLDDQSSIKASYNRTTQPIHLISNTTASTPLDVWTPSTNNLRPQLADQIAIGYFRNFGESDDYETSVETYYKDMKNQVDYIDGADLLLNRLLEGDLLIGRGRAYGFELFVKKTKGKLTGWVSYTGARSERLVEGINNNEWFPNRFDKLHTLNVVSSYDITDRIDVSANFVFATGTPATFPSNRIEWQEYIIPHNVNNPRNNVRIPAYHRLDVSATFKLRKKWKGKYDHNLVASAYNVYARRNPFSIYFQANQDNPQRTEAIRFSVVGNIIPSVTYNFKF